PRRPGRFADGRLVASELDEGFRAEQVWHGRHVALAPAPDLRHAPPVEGPRPGVLVALGDPRLEAIEAGEELRVLLEPRVRLATDGQAARQRGRGMRAAFLGEAEGLGVSPAHQRHFRRREALDHAIRAAGGEEDAADEEREWRLHLAVRPAQIARTRSRTVKTANPRVG